MNIISRETSFAAVDNTASANQVPRSAPRKEALMITLSTVNVLVIFDNLQRKGTYISEYAEKLRSDCDITKS